MIQIQIALPLLIKQKITNYLDFTTWQEKMTEICQEYKDNYPEWMNIATGSILALLKIYKIRKDITGDTYFSERIFLTTF